MSNGQPGTGGGYVPIVGKEAASDPNAVYITANEPVVKPGAENRRSTKEFHLKFNLIEQERLVDGEWVVIPANEKQPFTFPPGLPGINNDALERVEAGRFYYLYISENDEYHGPFPVKATVTFTVSDANGGYPEKGKYVHEVPHYTAS